MPKPFEREVKLRIDNDFECYVFELRCSLHPEDGFSVKSAHLMWMSIELDYLGYKKVTIAGGEAATEVEQAFIDLIINESSSTAYQRVRQAVENDEHSNGRIEVVV